MPVVNADNDLFFYSPAIADDAVFIRAMTGREAVSQLYEFELALETTATEPLERAQLDDLLARPCQIVFGRAEEHRIHGILRSIEMQPVSAVGDRVTYRVFMVPNLWVTTQSIRSRVYQDMTIPGLVKSVLIEAGMEEGLDFDLSLDRRHMPREYVVQYQETDYQFICRWMEYEGIFFFFEHGDSRAKLVISDNNEVFTRLAGHESIAFLPRGGVTDAAESITALAQRIERIPQKLVMRDYNYRTPSTALLVESPVDPVGTGTHAVYGEHFKDHDEGKRLVKIRAEEIRARKEVFRGESVVRGLHAGHRFHLEGHPVGVFEQDYIVTSLTHSVEQTVVVAGADAKTTEGYRNAFEAIPYEVAYRAPRMTPRPRISGFTHAKIDGPQDAVEAPIDEHGRYKVLLACDTVAKPGGRASRWIRMAQPHAGPTYGMHFPLYIGAEVILAHLDGDPDRPVIIGAVANPDSMTPAHAGNSTQAVIRTRSGISMRFEHATGSTSKK